MSLFVLCLIMYSEWNDFLRGNNLQVRNGSPVYPCGQLHIGMWLNTAHCAFCPQVPGHGSTHLFLMHALFLWHSVLSTHSGLQPVYGSPWNSAWQVQIPFRHCAFGPQGDGSHGSFITGSLAVREKNEIIFGSEWIVYY
jgi:hypothetical protein